MHMLEICANSYQSAINAETGGAHRIELCQNLEAGGMTPSMGLIKRVKQRLRIPVFVLIRPRTGDFVYSDDDFEIMLEDIRACRDLLAADGIAVGVLTQAGLVDVKRMKALVDIARPMSATFHRAFDDCVDLSRALEDVIGTGCTRILTSGGVDSAEEGKAVIADLVKRADGRIVVMPGAGIIAQNLGALVQATGATEFHASAKTSIYHTIPSRFAASQLQADADEVQALISVLAELE